MEESDARPGRVPVEHRLVGLDRRTLPFALVALAVWVLWAVVVPRIDAAVDFDREVRAGERVQLSDESSFAPAPGWGLRGALTTSDRPRTGARSVGEFTVVKDNVVLTVKLGAWSGTPRELLEQINRISTTTRESDDAFTLSTRPTTLQTGSGETGVIEGYRSARNDGVIAAFVFDDVGIELQALGPRDQMAHHDEEIEQMLRSVRDDGPPQ